MIYMLLKLNLAGNIWFGFKKNNHKHVKDKICFGSWKGIINMQVYISRLIFFPNLTVLIRPIYNPTDDKFLAVHDYATKLSPLWLLYITI